MCSYICNNTINFKNEQWIVQAEICEVFHRLSLVFADAPDAQAPTPEQCGRITTALDRATAAVSAQFWPQLVFREHAVENIIKAARQEYQKGNSTSTRTAHWLRITYLICRLDLVRTSGAWPPIIPTPSKFMLALNEKDNRVLCNRGHRDLRRVQFIQHIVSPTTASASSG